MVPVTLKNRGTLDFLARVFGMKPPTFELLVTKFIRLCSEPIFDKFVLESLVRYGIHRLVNNKKVFKNYPSPSYATNMTFQQANQPSGSIEGGNKYYSGKHKLYGYKVEVSVLPIDLAMNCTNQQPKTVVDVDIFYRNADFHDLALSKADKDTVEDIPDIGSLKSEYSDKWVVLVGKGYQGVIDSVRAVYLKKKLKNGYPTGCEECHNNDQSVITMTSQVIESLYKIGLEGSASFSVFISTSGNGVRVSMIIFSSYEMC